MEFSDLQGQIDELNVLIDSDKDSDSDFAYASARKKARQAKRADRRAKRQDKRATRLEKKGKTARAEKVKGKADVNKQKSQGLKSLIADEEGGEGGGAELESPEGNETETTDSATKSPKKLFIIGGIVVALGIISLIIYKVTRKQTI